MEETRTYESMIDEWIETYKYCLNFENQIPENSISEEDLDGYLQEKAKLIVCLGNLFAIKCISEKAQYDIEFVKQIFEQFKEYTETKEVKLTDFDNNYISEMIIEMQQDFSEKKEETEE